MRRILAGRIMLGEPVEDEGRIIAGAEFDFTVYDTVTGGRLLDYRNAVKTWAAEGQSAAEKVLQLAAERMGQFIMQWLF